MASSPISSPVRGIYWPLSATNFQPSARETNYITHIYCAFFVPSNVTFKIEVDDLTAPKLKNSTSTLRSMEPDVKILYSISGDNADPLLFSQMVSSKQLRSNFINSSIEVARNFEFDGIDLHWQFPENQSDMDNLGTLLREWRDAVRKDAEKSKKPPLLLVAATYFLVDIIQEDQPNRRYPVVSLSENLDWINVMCYDYHYWSKDTPVTGAPAALYDPTRNNNCTSYGLESWIQAGFPPNKLIMGLPLFGRTWTLYDKSSHGIGAPAVGMGPGTKGYLTYPEVVQFNRENHAHVVDDTTYVTAYSFSGICWVGYDDSDSITKKIQYARPQGLGGYFFWEFNGPEDWELFSAAYEAWPSTPAN